MKPKYVHVQTNTGAIVGQIWHNDQAVYSANTGKQIPALFSHELTNEELQIPTDRLLFILNERYPPSKTKIPDSV